MKKILNCNLTSWQVFAQQNNLTDLQLEKFKIYYEHLSQANALFSITTISDLASVLNYHFQDSLALGSYFDLSKTLKIFDVGTGGGFPGIPLKILYPHLQLTLIEVSLKKLNFLKNLVTLLELDNVDFVSQDWRMYLRSSKIQESEDIENYLFCARASLSVQELLRVFKPSSCYKNSKLIYWASKDWQPDKNEISFIKNEYSYTVGSRQRRLILFGI